MQIRSIALFFVATLKSLRAAVLASLRIPNIGLPVIVRIRQYMDGFRWMDLDGLRWMD